VNAAYQPVAVEAVQNGCSSDYSAASEPTFTKWQRS